MAAKLRVLIDLNVVLDVLQRREPFYEMSARVLASVETGLVEGWVAAHSITTLYYLLAKHHSHAHARAVLTDTMTLLSVAAVDQSVIEQALNLPYPDFEDAVQMMAAARSDLQYVVTRDVRDFSAGPLPALQPAELLALV
jgi:predicted nucleic acid-binding protein